MPIDADIQQVLESIADQPLTKAANGTLEELRRFTEQVEFKYDLTETPMYQERSLPVHGPNGPIPVRIYWPRKLHPAEHLPIVLFMHGGGWAFCSMDTHENMLRYLCKKADIIGINIDYRLAPEHKFPTALADCWEILEWTSENSEVLGASRDHIYVGGDSAGGNLAAVLCLLARDWTGPSIAAQLLFYPSLAIGASPRYPSWSELPETRRQEYEEELDILLGHYLNSPDEIRDFRVSPILAANHCDLPKALIITAQYDPLKDDGLNYAEKLKSSSVEVEYKCFEGAVHAFMSLAGGMSRGYEALNYVSDFIRRESTSAGYHGISPASGRGRKIKL